MPSTFGSRPRRITSSRIMGGTGGMCSSNVVPSCLTAFSSLRPTPCTLSVSALKLPMTELGLTAFYDKGTPVTTACPLSSEAMPCSSSVWPDTLRSLAFWSSSRTPVSTGSEPIHRNADLSCCRYRAHIRPAQAPGCALAYSAPSLARPLGRLAGIFSYPEGI